MISFLIDNLSSILISLAVIVASFAAIRKIIKDKKNSAACSSCSLKGNCDKCISKPKDKE